MTTLVRGDWQVRAGFAYDVAPSFRLNSAYLAFDRDIADRQAIRLAVTHTIGPGEDTVFQAASVWRFNAFDLALTGGWSTRESEWRVGLQFAFGLLFDPSRGRYRAVRPGVAAGGAVAFESWVDRNGDGRRQADEEAVPGLIVRGGPREAATDARGRALSTGLGDGAAARLDVGADEVADPYLSGGPGAVEIVPRPGRLAVVQAPLQTTGEAELRVALRRPAGEPQPLSAVRLQLTDAAGAVAAEGRSEYDGSLPVEGLRPGRYAVRLDPEQAARLGLRLAEPAEVVVPVAGGWAGVTAVLLERTS